MTKPQDDDQPKYMRIEGKTLFEMAQSIDSAFTNADNNTPINSHDVALQWWFEQFEQQLSEDMELGQIELPNVDICQESVFILQCCRLYDEALFHNPEKKDEAQIRNQVRMLLQSSLLDVIDMMQAKKIWQFDLQRKLQTLQGRVLNEFQQARPSA